MSNPSSSKPTLSWRAAFMENIADDPSHPLQIALRTYSLCLSLSLSPALLSTIWASAVDPKSFPTRARLFLRALLREVQPTGFASAITAAIGGGAALQRLWCLRRGRQHTPGNWSWIHNINSKLLPCQRTFLANVTSSTLAVILLRWKRYRRLGTTSPTLDLSLLLLVRALDASVQALLIRKARDFAAQDHASSRNDAVLRPSDTKLLDKESEDLAKAWKNKVSTRLDTLVFWASSARIMWCFFYQPQRLPASFTTWINSLANVDKRLLQVLRALREGTWSYIGGSSAKRHIALSLAEQLGRSPSWADPTVLPAYGGGFANKVWKEIGVDGRCDVGGLPCELVHGGIGTSFGLQSSCVANATIRVVYAFAQALVLHLPVHFLPIILTEPSSIPRPRRALSALLSAIRSAIFLSTFSSSCWFGVCFTRTLVLARLFPNISHDFWDGPYGGTLVGSLVCGTSIWIENAKRRREVALYVLPKALRALVPEVWLRSRHPVAQLVECLTFVLSLASLLTFSAHQPESLRGLSRWTLAFVMNGPKPGSWKKSKRETTAPPPTRAVSSMSPVDSGHRAD